MINSVYEDAKLLKTTRNKANTAQGFSTGWLFAGNIHLKKVEQAKSHAAMFSGMATWQT